MKIILLVLGIIMLLLLSFLFKGKLFLFLYFLETNINKIDILYKLMGIVGIVVALLTLWFNFLKPPSPDMNIAKSAVLIWHDKILNSAPMIDIFCTFSNTGARSIIIDRIEVELFKNNEKTIFSDFLFLKHDSNKGWVQDEYSHPIFVNKYSEKSMMVGFKNNDLKYTFVEGEYILKAKAYKKNKCVVENKIMLNLTKEQTDRINLNKNNANNVATEVPIE